MRLVGLTVVINMRDEALTDKINIADPFLGNRLSLR
jgi:hypothetical protein